MVSAPHRDMPDVPVDNSDMVNGDLVLHSSITPTKVVNVVEDEFYILM